MAKTRAGDWVIAFTPETSIVEAEQKLRELKSNPEHPDWAELHLQRSDDSSKRILRLRQSPQPQKKFSKR